LSDDFELAREPVPALPYEPFAQLQKTLEAKDMARYWRQGAGIGRVDNAAGSLIIDAQSDNPQIMTLGKFMTSMADPTFETSQNVKSLTDLFVGFHPATRPVLWRILITKAHVYHAFMASKESRLEGHGDVATPWSPITIKGEQAFDWRQPDSQISDSVVHAPFEAAKAYLRRNMSPSGEAIVTEIVADVNQAV